MSFSNGHRPFVPPVEGKIETERHQGEMQRAHELVGDFGVVAGTALYGAELATEVAHRVNGAYKGSVLRETVHSWRDKIALIGAYVPSAETEPAELTPTEVAAMVTDARAKNGEAAALETYITLHAMLSATGKTEQLIAATDAYFWERPRG